MVFKDPSYKVKNTFVEIPAATPEDNDMGRQRRTRSDNVVDGLRQSPLVVASKSPTGSPQLQPVDETMQAMPIEECDFELLEEAAIPIGDPAGRGRGDMGLGETPVAQATPGLGRDEPAYVVPTTPSPFLHSAFPPSVVPPFSSYGYGMTDMGLPPAFGADGESCQDPESFMQGVGYLSPEMFDPNFGYTVGYGWPGLPQMEAGAFGPGGSEVGARQPQAGATCPAEGSWEEQAVSEQAGVDGASGAIGGADTSTLADQKTKDGGSRRSKGRNREGKAAGAAPAEEKVENLSVGGAGRSGKAAANAAGASAASVADATTGGSGGGPKAVEETTGSLAQAASLAKDEIPGNYTTVMLRNIPNKYTREMLVKQLSQDFSGQFDFMYLPIDFKNKCNVGYGFINFRMPEHCAKFVEMFHGVDVRKCLPGLNSKKVVEVTPARVQGLSENVRRLRNSPVMNQLQDHPEWMPLLFNEDGFEEPFPMPDQPLPPVKPRGRNREVANRADA
mmetsp:Transcript_47998/g.133917  ORF Transcript_47998/g.133917 Transcript_47998/m.133917 type:complete len:504 (-) Transcript_47998:139-1650(-)